MKILLVSANRLSFPYPVYPLGIDHVAGILLRHDHEVQVLDLIGTRSNAGIASVIKSFGPDLVGLSLRNIDNTDITDTRWFIDEYREIMHEIRLATKAPVVLGGAGFTLFARELMDLLNADFGFYGEGEYMAELADRLQEGQDVSDVPGLLTRGTDAVLPAPWKGPFVRGIEQGVLPLDFYLRTGGMANIQTKRGCPFHCVYCTYPSIEGHRVRLFPPKDVARAARILQDKGAKFLFIADAVFNTHPEHNIRIAHAMRRAGVTLPWGAFFTPVPARDGYFQELAACGLTHVEFGTESLSDKTLRAYGKRFNTKQVFEAHTQALGAGLNVAHYFMLGGPGETLDTLHETLRNVEKLERTVIFFFCGVRVYPGTGLYTRAVKEGLVDPTSSLLQPVFYRSPGMETVDIEAEVIRAAKGRTNWIVGGGEKRIARVMAMMYRKGRTGPLWEDLTR